MKFLRTSFDVAVGTMISTMFGLLACGSSNSPESPNAPEAGISAATNPPDTSSDAQADVGVPESGLPSNTGSQDSGTEAPDGGQAPLVTIFTLGGTGSIFDLNGSGVVPITITPVSGADGADGGDASSDGGTNDSDAGVTLTAAQVAALDAVGYALITTTHNFNWVPIQYPASAFPMNSSVATGVASLIAAINALPVGSPFVLEGISQGAIATSQVLNEIQSGSLTSRQQDLLAGVTFGNPCREQGHLWPNAVDPGSFDNAALPGHGILVSCELTGTPALWWDFVNPLDPATTVGTDDAGQVLSAAFDILYASVTGAGSIGSLIEEMFTDLGFDQALLPGIDSAINELMLFAGPNDPHALYWSTAPQANPPTTLTSAQVAINYLSEVGENWRVSH